MSEATCKKEDESKALSIELGRKIRALRTEKNLKIIDIARRTGLSSSFISQVERALVSPSIDTLKKIGDAMDTPISHFFISQEEEEEIKNGNRKKLVVHEHERKILSPEPGVTLYLLNVDMSGPIEFTYNIYEPGAGTGSETYSHEGQECGLILEGELEVTVGDEVYLLKKGDSITFDSGEQHAKRNVGDVPCISVWANTPPWF